MNKALAAAAAAAAIGFTVSSLVAPGVASAWPGTCLPFVGCVSVPVDPRGALPGFGGLPNGLPGMPGMPAIAAPPVMAPPVMAPPVMAPPVVAPPVLAPPVLAAPAPAIIAPPIAPPVVAPPVEAALPVAAPPSLPLPEAIPPAPVAPALVAPAPPANAFAPAVPQAAAPVVPTAPLAAPDGVTTSSGPNITPGLPLPPPIPPAPDATPLTAPAPPANAFAPDGVTTGGPNVTPGLPLPPPIPPAPPATPLTAPAPPANAFAPDGVNQSTLPEAQAISGITGAPLPGEAPPAATPDYSGLLSPFGPSNPTSPNGLAGPVPAGTPLNVPPVQPPSSVPQDLQNLENGGAPAAQPAPLNVPVQTPAATPEAAPAPSASSGGLNPGPDGAYGDTANPYSICLGEGTCNAQGGPVGTNLPAATPAPIPPSMAATDPALGTPEQQFTPVLPPTASMTTLPQGWSCGGAPEGVSSIGVSSAACGGVTGQIPYPPSNAAATNIPAAVPDAAPVAAPYQPPLADVGIPDQECAAGQCVLLPPNATPQDGLFPVPPPAATPDANAAPPVDPNAAPPADPNAAPPAPQQGPCQSGNTVDTGCGPAAQPVGAPLAAPGNPDQAQVVPAPPQSATPSDMDALTDHPSDGQIPPGSPQVAQNGGNDAPASAPAGPVINCDLNATFINSCNGALKNLPPADTGTDTTADGQPIPPAQQLPNADVPDNAPLSSNGTPIPQGPPSVIKPGASDAGSCGFGNYPACPDNPSSPAGSLNDPTMPDAKSACLPANAGMAHPGIQCSGLNLPSEYQGSAGSDGSCSWFNPLCVPPCMMISGNSGENQILFPNPTISPGTRCDSAGGYGAYVVPGRGSVAR
jgi:hypothetical protein